MISATNGQRSLGATFIWVFAVVLLVAHQDFWLWDDHSLVFGFLPIGLAYHALYSLAAAGLWALAIKFAWPSHIEQWAGGDEQEGSKP